MIQRLTSSALLLMAFAGTCSAATTAYWRLEEGTPGADVTAAQDSSGNAFHQTSRSGDPNYSAAVPGPFIFDPVAGTTVANTGSLDASLANSRVNTVNDPAFDTSFTVEMFILFTEEPTGYNSYLRRNETNAHRWQLDFDHALQGAYGRGRSRFDTPDGDNVNFVTGPTGGASVPASERLWVDTDAGDNDPASYDDPDWFTDGDGLNDNLAWRHIAVTFDQATQEVSYYTDYVLSQSRTLVDTDGSGYVHPDARLDFGKFGTEYGTFMDEIRYSDTVLDSSQFLQAVPEPGSAALGLFGAGALLLRRRR